MRNDELETLMDLLMVIPILRLDFGGKSPPD